MKRRKGFYSISVVAKMFSVHQQTIRMYEKEGLISPKRTGGNTRLFSEEDVDRLEQIINLTHKLGVNLAGVQIILRLQKKMQRMQKEMNDVFNKMHGQLEEESEKYKTEVHDLSDKLVSLKKDKKTDIIDLPQTSIDENKEKRENKRKSGKFSDESDENSPNDWEVDYDDN